MAGQSDEFTADDLLEGDPDQDLDDELFDEDDDDLEDFEQDVSGAEENGKSVPMLQQQKARKNIYIFSGIGLCLFLIGAVIISWPLLFPVNKKRAGLPQNAFQQQQVQQPASQKSQPLQAYAANPQQENQGQFGYPGNQGQGTGNTYPPSARQTVNNQQMRNYNPQQTIQENSTGQAHPDQGFQPAPSAPSPVNSGMPHTGSDTGPGQTVVTDQKPSEELKQILAAIKTLSTSQSTLVSTIQKAGRKKSGNSSEMQRLTGEVEALRTRLEKAQKAIATKEEKITSLNADMTGLNSDMKDLKGKNDHLRVLERKWRYKVKNLEKELKLANSEPLEDTLNAFVSKWELSGMTKTKAIFISSAGDFAQMKPGEELDGVIIKRISSAESFVETSAGKIYFE